MSTFKSNQKLSQFKALFETEKKRLLFSHQVMNESFNVRPEEMKDEIDFTSYELENQMLMRLRNREALYIKKIDEALERIRAGSFGSCESCEEEIELKRLEARPTTTFCMECKESSERNEKVHIDGWKSKSLGKEFKIA